MTNLLTVAFVCIGHEGADTEENTEVIEAEGTGEVRNWNEPNYSSMYTYEGTWVGGI